MKKQNFKSPDPYFFLFDSTLSNDECQVNYIKSITYQPYPYPTLTGMSYNSRLYAIKCTAPQHAHNGSDSLPFSHPIIPASHLMKISTRFRSYSPFPIGRAVGVADRLFSVLLFRCGCGCRWVDWVFGTLHVLPSSLGKGVRLGDGLSWGRDLIKFCCVYRRS